MGNIARPIYKKHNSFIALRHKHGDALAAALSRIGLLHGKPESNLGLSDLHREILKKVFDDLLGNHSGSKAIRFSLSPNVLEEISTYSDAVLPKYLVHRYRYEIFPQLKILDDYPPYLQIEPSSICNYRCVFCFESDPTFTDRRTGFMGLMSMDMFKKIVDQAEGHVEFISLASRGEPLICKAIIPMLEYTKGKFLNLKINTNASLLDEAKCHAILSGGVKTVVFSADAATEQLYSKLRVNGKIEVVLRNIELFQKIRQTQYPDLPIITRVSGVKFSDDQDIDSMQQMWGGLVDQVAFVQYNPWENIYQQSANGMLEPCSDLWRRMFVWWDGRANPCDVDYKSTLVVGNLAELTLSELWKSSQYQHLRQVHLLGKRGSLYPCSACTVV